MHILVYRWKCDYYHDIECCFRSLGHSIDAIEHNLVDKYNDQKFIAKMETIIGRTHYDCVFSVEFFPVISEICNSLKMDYISWALSSPLPQMYHKSIFNDCNYIFVYDRFTYEEFKEMDVSHIWHLPAAVNLKRISEIVENVREDEFSGKISYVGKLYENSKFDEIVDILPPYLRGYLDCAIETQLYARGADILANSINDMVVNMLKPYYDVRKPPGFLADPSMLVRANLLSQKIASVDRHRSLMGLGKFFDINLYNAGDIDEATVLGRIQNKGTADYLKDIPKIYHNSLINLNFAQPNTVSGMSPKVLEIIASGGFVITYEQDEIEDYFEIGKSIVCFTNAVELKEKVWYYMNHGQERKEIIEKGLDIIKKEHTYPIRMKNMIERYEKCKQ